jgi:hypothetical protein
VPRRGKKTRQRPTALVVDFAQTHGVRARRVRLGAWATESCHERCAAIPRAMTTLADLNGLWPADHNATPWVATPDGAWSRATGAGINPNIPPLQKEGATRRLSASLRRQDRRQMPAPP